MTKVKCGEESIFHICRHLKKGVCQLPEIELTMELIGNRGNSVRKCENIDTIYNGNEEEWEKYKNNRTKEYLPHDYDIKCNCSSCWLKTRRDKERNRNKD